LLGILSLLHGASSSEVRHLLLDDIDPTSRTIRLVDLVNTMDPELVAATFGMDPGGVMIYLADHVREGRLLDQKEIALVADWPYGGGEPQVETVTGTYADAGLRLPVQQTVQYPYSLGEIVTAAAQAGLVVMQLGEHIATDIDPRNLLHPDEDNLYRLRFGDSHLPILYSLRAVLPDVSASRS
jgi:hypothetical protein